MSLIYLIGMPGSGKTTIGKKLASVLALDFHDMDHMIEMFQGKTIPQIFAEEGEDYFREVEKKVLKDTDVFQNAVISTGGGVPCFFDNMEVLKKAGTTVYLKVSAEELFKRLEHMEGRPLLDGKKKDALLEELNAKLAHRAQFYEQADIVIEGDDIQVDEVLKQLKTQKWISDRLPQ